MNEKLTPCREYQSPNSDSFSVTVEFLVLHYSAGSLQATLDIFTDSSRKASSHLIIDDDGKVYELVPCWEGNLHRAWHCGKSRWNDGEKIWEHFNDISIGIELVNRNGNLFPYTEEQYKSLQRCIQHLRSIYPVLTSPDRIIGHEQISGWRGKADPGLCFDWQRLYRDCFPGEEAPVRAAVCPPELQTALELLGQFSPGELKQETAFWHTLSLLTETSVRLSVEQKHSD